MAAGQRECSQTRWTSPNCCKSGTARMHALPTGRVVKPSACLFKPGILFQPPKLTIHWNLSKKLSGTHVDTGASNKISRRLEDAEDHEEAEPGGLGDKGDRGSRKQTGRPNPGYLPQMPDHWGEPGRSSSSEFTMCQNYKVAFSAIDGRMQLRLIITPCGLNRCDPTLFAARWNEGWVLSQMWWDHICHWSGRTTIANPILFDHKIVVCPYISFDAHAVKKY